MPVVKHFKSFGLPNQAETTAFITSHTMLFKYSYSIRNFTYTAEHWVVPGTNVYMLLWAD